MERCTALGGGDALVGVAGLLDLICHLADDDLALADVLALSCCDWIWDWFSLQGEQIRGLADISQAASTGMFMVSM